MNLGQMQLRIWQLEDELEALRAARVEVDRPHPVVRASRIGQCGGLPQRVVDLLAAAERPLGSNDIAARLDCDVVYLYQKLPELIRAGRITRLGRRKHYQYWTPLRVAA